MSSPVSDAPAAGRVGYFAPELDAVEHLGELLRAGSVTKRPVGPIDTVLAWGHGDERAIAAATTKSARLVYVWPSFVGSGLLLDDLGAPFAADRSSRLETRLRESNFGAQLLERAGHAIATLRDARLLNTTGPVVELGSTEAVLVVLEPDDAPELRHGLCETSAEALIELAMAENPGAEVVVQASRIGAGRPWTHPRVQVVRAPGCAPLEHVARVYARCSQVAFEALMVGLPVACVGVPWFAGWGLTDDRGPVPDRRGRRRNVEELFAAAYIDASRYVDPESGDLTRVERIIKHLALQRAMGEVNAGQTVCVGFTFWKRHFIPSFLQGPRSRVSFARSAKQARRQLEPGGRLLIWGRKEAPGIVELAEEKNAEVWRMEDGFLRSVGLGSDLYQPASLVIDREGIYFDPNEPSELETILQTGEFTEGELQRACALRKQISAAAVSKYNVGITRPIGVADRPVVLVVGQVEDDASIKLGTLDICTNEALLRAARQARPDAHIMYKPHPDVVSGNRKGDIARPLDICDELVGDVALPECLRVASEVHTMTSLVGFESLIREIRVVVYGLPFYAGWGLSEDRHAHPRRTRRLTLDQLVAGTLIRYPRYISPKTGQFTTPERIVDELASHARHTFSAAPVHSVTRTFRRLRHYVRVVRDVL